MGFISPLNILDYGGVVGGADNAAALNSCLVAEHGSLTREVEFPVGEYWFNTQPANLSNARLIGQSESTTLLTCNYAGKFLVWDGASGQGGGLNHLCLFSRMPASNPVWRGLSFESQGTPTVPVSQSGYSEIEDLVITGLVPGSLLYGIVIDGTNTGAFGMRDLNFRNATILQCANAGISITNGVGIRYTDGYCQGNVYVGGLSNGININMKIDGAITVAPSCTNVVINGVKWT